MPSKRTSWSCQFQVYSALHEHFPKHYLAENLSAFNKFMFTLNVTRLAMGEEIAWRRGFHCKHSMAKLFYPIMVIATMRPTRHFCIKLDGGYYGIATVVRDRSYSIGQSDACCLTDMPQLWILPLHEKVERNKIVQLGREPYAHHQPCRRYRETQRTPPLNWNILTDNRRVVKKTEYKLWPLRNVK